MVVVGAGHPPPPPTRVKKVPEHSPWLEGEGQEIILDPRGSGSVTGLCLVFGLRDGGWVGGFEGRKKGLCASNGPLIFGFLSFFPRFFFWFWVGGVVWPGGGGPPDHPPPPSEEWHIPGRHPYPHEGRGLARGGGGVPDPPPPPAPPTWG